MHNAQRSIRYVGICMLECYVDGSVDEEGFLNDADSITITFGWAPDSC